MFGLWSTHVYLREVQSRGLHRSGIDTTYKAQKYLPAATGTMVHGACLELHTASHSAERDPFSSNKRKAAEPVTFPVDTVEEAARGVG
jgi:hypothetical protein